MTPQDDKDIFDDSFEDFEDDGVINQSHKGGAGAGGTSSLLDLWNNNPMVKLAVIAGLVVIAIGSVYAFVGGGDKGPQTPSMVGQAPEDKEAPGGLVSETYGDALEEQNQQKLEQALGNREVSAIPVPVNRGDPSLNPGGDQGVVTEDPLAVWQRENAQPTLPEEPLPEPAIPPPPPPPPPQANPEQVSALSDAINNQIQNILANRAVKPGQYVQFQMDGLQTVQAQQQQAAIDAAQAAAQEQLSIEEILVPAGTILYAQILNMADSDAPGPIVAQILSGPLVGARAIGDFQEEEEKIIISFNTAVVDGVGNNMNGVAIDPATTSPGLVTDIDRRYFRRIILPAAGRFIEGLGNAYAQQETQVFATGDVIVTEQNKLSTKEQLASGVAEGAEKAADILEDEGDRLRPRVQVAAGTPIGIILVDPIVKPGQDQVYNQP